MERKCTLCGKSFNTPGGHCPECVAKANAERVKLQAAADRRNAIHVLCYEQERRQANGGRRVELKEAV